MCALYPVFPRDPNDNRYHLQALRHFWVMAIETRMVQVRDIDSGDYIQTNATMKFSDGRTKKCQTPLLIEEGATSLELSHERYYSTTAKVKSGKIVLQNNSNSNNNLEQIVFVKRKNI
jgi:anaphase-promoting complex subunit 1